MTASNRENEIPHLTGLRGYAALGVFIVHTVLTSFPDLPSPLKEVVYAGRYGVVVFFTLSAYTIALSLDRKTFYAGQYALKRFFRIAPAYYVVLAILLVVGFQSPFAETLNTPYDLNSFFLHLTYLNFLAPGHMVNALGVEHTLAVEALYYVLLPAMIIIARRWFGVAGLFAIALACLVIPPKVLTFNNEAIWIWWRTGPLPYAICFVSGAVAFIYRDTILRLIGRAAIGLAPTAMFAAIFWHPPNDIGISTIYYTLISVALILGGSSWFGQKVLANPVAYQLGKYSYSLYLVHYPIILSLRPFLENGWQLLIGSAVLSSIATVVLFHAVEEPMRRLPRSDRFKRALKRLRPRQA